MILKNVHANPEQPGINIDTFIQLRLMLGAVRNIRIVEP